MTTKTKAKNRILEAVHELLAGAGQQILGEGLQCFLFFDADVGPFVLLEAEHEEPQVALVGGHQGSDPAALAPAGQAHPLLDHAAAEICVDQPLRHLAHGATQGLVGQRGLAHPATEVAGFEDSIHRQTISPGDLLSKTHLLGHLEKPLHPPSVSE